MSTRSSHQSPVASAAPFQPSKPTLRYTYIAKGRYHRFRHPVTGGVPLPGDPDQPAFYRAYSALLGRVAVASGKPVPAADEDKATLAWLINDYQSSADFRQLAVSTRSDYNRYLRRFVEDYGDRDYRRLTDAGVLAIRKPRETSARAAGISVAVLSAVMTYAINRRILPRDTLNPCHGIDNVVHKVTAHTPWNEPHERRRKRDSASTRLPLTKTGAEYNARLLAKDLRIEMRNTGLEPGLTTHGLRYAAVGHPVEMSCDVEAIIAVTGHRCYEMAIKYLRRRKAAACAADAMNAHDTQKGAAAKAIANSKIETANSRRKVQQFQ